MAGAVYLADTSVYVPQGKHPQVRHRFEKLLAEGGLAACQLTALEHTRNRTVLHYDADHDRIAAITGQPTEWVAPRGSL